MILRLRKLRNHLLNKRVCNKDLKTFAVFLKAKQVGHLAEGSPVSAVLEKFCKFVPSQRRDIA